MQVNARRCRALIFAFLELLTGKNKPAERSAVDWRFLTEEER